MKRRLHCVIVLMLGMMAAGAQPVKLLSATIQPWVSEAPGGKSGTTYTVKLLLKTKKAVTFKNMWLGQKQVQFSLQTFFADPNRNPAKGDSVLLVYVKDAGSDATNTSSVPPAIDYKGAGLIEYTENEKHRYVTISNFVGPGMKKRD